MGGAPRSWPAVTSPVPLRAAALRQMPRTRPPGEADGLVTVPEFGGDGERRWAASPGKGPWMLVYRLALVAAFSRFAFTLSLTIRVTKA
jgi:hypothetical protein